MRDITAELKELRLYGMASAWEEVAADENGMGVQTSRWLIEHLLQAEHTDRHMRSVRYQLHSAKFPVHRDLAGFEFAQSKVDKRLIDELATLAFTEQAHNVVLIGGTGTGKTHLATALGVAGITRHNKRVRFFSTVDLSIYSSRKRRRARPGGWPSRYRQLERSLGHRNLVDRPGPLERYLVQEAQRAGRDADTAGREHSGLRQMDLIGTNLLRTEFCR